MTQLKANVLMIGKRDREERARLAAANATQQQLNAPYNGHTGSPEGAEFSEVKSRTELAEPHVPKRPSQPFAPTHASSSARDEQPESWVPRASLRRGR